MKVSILRIFSVIAASAVLGAISASAVPSISYSLTVPNAAISGYTGPYGSVEVDLNSSTTATITFTGNTVSGFTFLFGGSQMADVNVNATSFSVSVSTPSTAKTPAAGNVSQFNDFNVTIDNKNASLTTSSVVFDVTNISGTWANVSSVLTANADGFVAAAHIIVMDATGAQVKTGFAGNTGGQVPDGGSTVALLGTGLLGLGWLNRMKIRNK